MNLRLLLIALEGERRELYSTELSKLNIKFDTVDSFGKLYDLMADVPYSGVLIDLNTKLRTPKDELALVRNIFRQFPVAELRCNNNAKKIGLFYEGQSSDGGNLNDFANRYCKTFEPRTLATEKRLNLNFNVLLSSTNNFDKTNAEKTITINVSKSGCFIFSTNVWQPGDNAWFIIQDIEDKTPMCGKVCWSHEWGKNIAIPGIGLQFKVFNQKQVDELYNTKIDKWARV